MQLDPGRTPGRIMAVAYSINVEVAMRTLVQQGRRFLKSEDGPTAVEYAVMLELIIVVCLVAITAVGTQVSTTFSNVASSLGGAS
jgi:pilus assembly protein Flp/PilA